MLHASSLQSKTHRSTELCHAKRPKAHITLGDRGDVVEALYDTGSNVSILRTDTFRKAKETPHCVARKLKGTIGIQAANGSPLQIEGVFLIRFTYQGVSCESPFVVCKDLNCPALLGMNLISQLALGFDAGTGLLRFDNAQIPRPAASPQASSMKAVVKLDQEEVVVHHRTVIHPRNTQRVQCFLRRPDGDQDRPATRVHRGHGTRLHPAPIKS